MLILLKSGGCCGRWCEPGGGKIDELPIGGVKLARAGATIAALCVIIHRRCRYRIGVALRIYFVDNDGHAA
jgi:hypothetical protein